VAVIGGGLSGIAAALRCADAGMHVTLYEAKARLGGLTCSYRRGDLWVDNGQHVSLRCCTAYRGLLTRLGVDEQTVLQSRMDIPVRSLTRSGRLRRNSLPAPLHLSSSLARYRWLRAHERMRFARAALALNRVDIAAPHTDMCSFGDWLRDHGQTKRAVENLWDLVGVATLNARADNASLSLAAKVFQTGLLRNADGGDIGWSLVPLQRLHGDAADNVLSNLGVHVLFRSRIRSLRSIVRAWVVDDATGTTEFDAVIVAVPPTEAERLLPADATALKPGWSGLLGTSPIVNLHLVFDRTVMDEPFIAAVGSDVQWVFDRTRQAELKNGQYQAVSLSAADEWIDVPTAALRAHFVPALRSLLPKMASASLRDFFVTRERDATFAPSPGTARYRPPARTPAPHLYLAGAWTATGWPATMESAVRSGDAAGGALLDDIAREASEAA
jgi:squalene-associated FAD-dependent desaturase